MEQALKEQRLSNLRKLFQGLSSESTVEHWIPEEVPRDYIPSGKIESKTIPILLLTGILGGGVGYGVSWILSSVSLGIFSIFQEAGICFTILFYPAGFIYILAPLAISICTGIGISIGGSPSACRSPSTGKIIGGILGIPASAASIYITKELLSDEPMNLIAGVITSLDPGFMSFVVVFVFGVCVWILTVQNSYIWYGMVGITGLIATIILSGEAGTTPYCEKTNKMLKEKIVKHHDIRDIALLLIGLSERNFKYLQSVRSIEKKETEDWDNIHRLDLIFWTAEGSLSNLIEVKAHYSKIKTTEKGDTIEKIERRVHSEWISREDATLFAQALSFDINYSENA